MRHRIHRLLIFAGVFISSLTLAQEPHSACTAAFLDGKLVVDAYTPTGKCRLAPTATGTLTVQTADLSPTKSIPVDPIDFKVAIRDKATGTMFMYSDKTYRQVPVQAVLSRCKKGDHIVLLTIDSRYALPHNEILIQ